jgi:hypothetical protein
MSTQDRCTVCAKLVIGSEIISDAPDGTPTVYGSSGGSFGSVWRYCKSRHKTGAQFVPNIPQTWKSFWAHPTVALVDISQVELVSVSLVIMLISMQDRGRVCAEGIIVSEIIVDTPDDIPT